MLLALLALVGLALVAVPTGKVGTESRKLECSVLSLVAPPWLEGGAAAADWQPAAATSALAASRTSMVGPLALVPLAAGRAAAAAMSLHVASRSSPSLLFLCCASRALLVLGPYVCTSSSVSQSLMGSVAAGTLTEVGLHLFLSCVFRAVLGLSCESRHVL